MGVRTREYKDYYGILGLPENAAEAEIKKSYRRLALEHHPDHNPGDPQSEEKFKEITEAYGVLINPRKRREYDLFRAAYLSGAAGDSSQFRYSQEDIFESMFREGFGRDIFEELNREFKRSGVRSGNAFFETMFFGGAVAGISRILGMIPGPLGKIGHGLRLAHMVGSSILAYNRMRQTKKQAHPSGEGPEPEAPGLKDTLKGFLNREQPAPEKRGELDLDFTITLPAAEALAGTQKKISYKVGDETESLMVRIPPNFPSGGKLRLKEKGNRKDDRCGDLYLKVIVKTD